MRLSLSLSLCPWCSCDPHRLTSLAEHACYYPPTSLFLSLSLLSVSVSVSLSLSFSLAAKPPSSGNSNPSKSWSPLRKSPGPARVRIISSAGRAIRSDRSADLRSAGQPAAISLASAPQDQMQSTGANTWIYSISTKSEKVAVGEWAIATPGGSITAV